MSASSSRFQSSLPSSEQFSHPLQVLASTFPFAEYKHSCPDYFTHLLQYKFSCFLINPFFPPRLQASSLRTRTVISPHLDTWHPAWNLLTKSDCEMNKYQRWNQDSDLELPTLNPVLFLIMSQLRASHHGRGPNNFMLSDDRFFNSSSSTVRNKLVIHG